MEDIRPYWQGLSTCGLNGKQLFTFHPPPPSKRRSSVFCNTHEIYFSDLLNFFSRYLAEVLLGILTMESSLLYLVRLQGVLQMQ